VYFLQVYVMWFVVLARDLFKSEVPELDFLSVRVRCSLTDLHVLLCT
jgi:hypothetical protein